MLLQECCEIVMNFWRVLNITLIFVKPKCRSLASIGVENHCRRGPSFNHLPWRCFRVRRARWGPPSRLIGVCGLRRVLGALSHDRGRQVYLWRCGRNLGQILRELPKISEVATSHWVFLSVIGHMFLVDFITHPRLRKKGIFPNLMWMAKNLDS